MNREITKAILLSLPLWLWGCSSGSGGASDDESRFSQQTPFAYVQRSLASDAQSRAAKFQALTQNSAQTPADISSPYRFNPGATLFIRAGLDSEASERDVLGNYFQSTDYDVKDLNVSVDGRYLIFSAHGPATDSNQQSTWDIYEYDFETDSIRRIISDDAIASAGQDTNPTYASDGSIVFSSDRSTGTIDEKEEDRMLAEKGCYKVRPNEKPSLLHQMSRQGENIVQLTKGSNHDTKPTTLKDGRVAFMRWNRSYELLSNCTVAKAAELLASGVAFPEMNNASYPNGLGSPALWTEEQKCVMSRSTPVGQVVGSNHYTLLRISVDGSELHQLYNTVTTSDSDEEFVNVSKIVQGENGQLLALLQHEYNQFSGGGLVQLENPSSVGNYGNVIFSNLAPKSLTRGSVAMYPSQASENGWYSALWSYHDGSSRMLVSWSQCTVEKNGVDSFCDVGQNANNVNARYGIWAYNPQSNSRLPIVRARRDAVFSDLAMSRQNSVSNYPFAPVNTDYVDSSDDGQIVCNDPSDYGSVHIHSVYDLDSMDMTDGGITAVRVPEGHSMDERKERFVRVISAGNTGAEEADLIGYAQIHPDGSAYFSVPADTEFTLQFVNKFAKEAVYQPGERYSYLQQHPVSMSVSSGKKLECHGCHEVGSGTVHGDIDTAPAPANSGASVAQSPFAGTNPDIIAENAGDTMAEAYAYTRKGVPVATADISYTDIWSQPDSLSPAESISYEYSQLNTSAPTSNACLTSWTADCRVNINYADHIQSLWEQPGRDSAGNSCVGCHDSDSAIRLDLQAISGDVVGVYNELFRVRSNYVFILDVFEQVSARKCKNIAQSPYPQTPDNDCNVCYEYRLMDKRGAFESATFFGLFDNDSDDDAWYFHPARKETVDHSAMLNSAERKMIAEWLDMGVALE